MLRLSLIAALALAAPAIAQDKAGFVVRLGADTLSVEEYTRTGAQVRGVSVTRTPRPSYRSYTLDLDASGNVRRFEMISERLDAGPGPARTTTTVDFGPDSARSRVPRGDSSATVTVASGSGAVPFLFGLMGPIEQLAVQLRTSGKETITVPLILPGGTQPWQATVRRGAGDTLVFVAQTQVGPVGPWILRCDARGRLLGFSGLGTQFQGVAERLASADVAGARAAFGTRPLGALSTRDTVRAKVGDADVTIDYSRPQRRGREIFGVVVPWNTVWRTGANQATHFKTSADLVIGGAAVPAGTYTLWTLPSPSGWKLILNKQTGQWGTVYSEQQDLARVELTLATLPAPVETFTIAIEPAGGGHALSLSWDRTRASVPVARKP